MSDKWQKKISKFQLTSKFIIHEKIVPEKKRYIHTYIRRESKVEFNLQIVLMVETNNYVTTRQIVEWYMPYIIYS